MKIYKKGCNRDFSTHHEISVNLNVMAFNV